MGGTRSMGVSIGAVDGWGRGALWVSACSRGADDIGSRPGRPPAGDADRLVTRRGWGVAGWGVASWGVASWGVARLSTWPARDVGGPGACRLGWDRSRIVRGVSAGRRVGVGGGDRRPWTFHVGALTGNRGSER